MPEPRHPRTLFGGAIESAFRVFLRRMPRQSRSQSLVEAVLQALDERLARGEPIDAVTIESLSEGAGVGVGSFYEYFSGKDSLLGAFIGHVTRQNFAKLAAELDAHQHASMDELIRAFTTNIAAVYVAHPVRMRVLVDGIARLGLLDVVNRERDRFAELMLEKGRAYLPGADEQRLRRTMRIIADAGMGVLVSWTTRTTHPEAHVVADELAELALAILARRHPEAGQERFTPVT